MIRISCLAVFLIVSVGCQSDKYKVEDKAWSCMKDRYHDLGIDIEKELSDYEDFLVEERYLMNKSGAAYLAVYELVVANNEMNPPPIKTDFRDKLQQSSGQYDQSPCLDSLETTRTRLHEVLVKGSEYMANTKNVEPRQVAQIVLDVYSEEDLEHPFYRYAFLGQVTLFMDRNMGLQRKLPPIKEAVDPVTLDPRNGVTIKIDGSDQITLKESPVTLKELRKRLIPFLRGSTTDPGLPGLKVEDIPGLGEVLVSQAVIQMQNDRNTSYKVYIAVENEVTAAVNQLREEASQRYFSKGLNSLSEEEYMAIKLAIPKKYKELAP